MGGEREGGDYGTRLRAMVDDSPVFSPVLDDCTVL